MPNYVKQPDENVCIDKITAKTGNGDDDDFIVWRPDITIRTSTDTNEGYILKIDHDDPVV